MKTFKLILIFLLSAKVYAKDFKMDEWQTSNGTHIILHQTMEVPILDINLAFAAGSAFDGQKFGLSELTTSMINQGNGGLNADTVADQLAVVGAQFASQSSKDMALLSLRTLTTSEILAKSTDTFALIVNQPDFPEIAFHREKNLQLVSISQTLESPNKIAHETFYKVLYQQHPYAHPIDGTKETVTALTINDVREFYKTFFVGKNATLVMVGAIDLQTAHQLADKITAHLPSGAPAPTIPKISNPKKEVNIAIPFPSSQTILLLGERGIDHHDPEYFPLVVGNHILGGGALTSRLATEVREKAGLAYDISSQFMPMPGYGPFLISLSTKNSQAQKAMDIVDQTLAAFVSSGPTEADLQATKEYLVGSFPLAIASNKNIADMLLKIAFYNLPKDYLLNYQNKIKAVTIAQIKAAFKKHIDLSKMIEIRVGKI